MLDFLIRQRLAAFERRWNFPMDHLRDLLRLSRRGFRAFLRAANLAALNDGVAPAPLAVARLVALRAEDCGPCVQLSVDMALAEGVDAALLAAALRDDAPALQRLDAQAALAHAFARGWVDDAADLDARREAARQAFGDRGLATLLLAMIGARLFPQLKRGLGHASACRLVRIAGAPVALPAAPAR